MALGLIDLNHFRVLDSRRSRSIFHSQRSLSINLITQPFRARAISSTSVVSHANSFEPTHAQDAYYQSTKFPKISLLPTAMFPLRRALQFTLATFRRQPQFRFVSDSFLRLTVAVSACEREESSRFSPTPQVPFDYSAKVF